MSDVKALGRALAPRTIPSPMVTPAATPNCGPAMKSAHCAQVARRRTDLGVIAVASPLTTTATSRTKEMVIATTTALSTLWRDSGDSAQVDDGMSNECRRGGRHLQRALQDFEGFLLHVLPQIRCNKGLRCDVQRRESLQGRPHKVNTRWRVRPCVLSVHNLFKDQDGYMSRTSDCIIPRPPTL